MKAAFVIVAAAVLGCKGKDCPPTQNAPVPETSAKPVATKCDTDPVFTHVDRDQLAALCVVAELPAPTVPSDTGALLLADGSRVPWVTVWMDEQFAAGDRPMMTAKAWTAKARAYMERVARSWDRPPQPSKPDGREWRNVLCGGDEALRVVISGVFFEKGAAHAVAVRGKQVLDEQMPANTPHDQVFRKAFELTTKVLGQPATIATHKLAVDPLSTVDTEDWVKAAK
ncbi:MAG TPA: hypothetical protein VFV99_17835 [Kofleriaceae bacterium]|nr:hypothetical protein [Kofleriaceae bacterium]